MADTAALWILLTNMKNQPLTLVSSKVIGSSSATKIDLPSPIGHATYGGLGVPGSTTPYQVTWTYSPDGGQTLLTFDVKLSGPKGITIIPLKSGPHAGDWIIGEEPHPYPGAWLVRAYYGMP
jgi:hypothetical protein